MSKYTDKWLQDLAAQNPDIRIVGEPKPPAPGTVAIPPKANDKLAREFEEAWAWAGGPDLVAEYKFHPVRKWAFDYAHPATMVAIELEGGIWTNGRHTNGAGFIGDCAKYNEAALLGWTVFRIPTGGVDPALLERIGKLIEKRIDDGDIPF